MRHKKDEFDADDGAGIISSVMKIVDGTKEFHERSRIFSLLPILGIVAAVGALVLYAYPKNNSEANNEFVPIVRADVSPVREAPEDEGGMAIPHKDSTVFETLRSADRSKSGRKIENLLPPPEQPIDRTTVFKNVDAEPPVMAQGTATAGPAVAVDLPVKTAEAQKPVETKAPLPSSPPSPLPETQVVQAAKKVAATEPAAGAALPVKKAIGNFYVQVGSVKTRADAQKGWAAYQAKYPQLKGMTLRVQEANLGAKGTFYRLQGGPVPEAEARKACAAIVQKSPGGCLAVKN